MDAQELMEVQIARIDLSSRIREVNQDHVKRLSEAILEELPPPVLVPDGNQYKVEAGIHRILAHKLKGRETIKAYVKKYPQSEEGRQAFEINQYRSNATHGLPLTKEERDQGVVKLRKNWKLTQEELGKTFGITKQRIGQILKEAQNVTTAPPEADVVEFPKNGFSQLSGILATCTRFRNLLANGTFQQTLAGEEGEEIRSQLEQIHQDLGKTLHPDSSEVLGQI